MTITPTTDHGETIAPPAGKVIGFFDRQTELDLFTNALPAAGFPAAKITSLYGDDGIRLLERLHDRSFFFGDSEDSVIQQSIQELRQGHYAVSVDVTDRTHAEQIAGFATKHGGRSFSHFGTWVSEQLTK